MAAITSRELRAGLADTLNRVAYGRERVLIERNGKPVAALVPVEDLEAIEAHEDAEDVADLKAALAEAQERGTKPLHQWISERDR
jgi:prevent-host-death family protein